MAKEFVNHHVHSHFSALDGLSKPHDIIDRVVEMGQRSVSITDHGNMSAIPEMYRQAQEAGIGFTPGIEAYFAKDRFYHKEDRLGEKYYHMILLAYSNQGYQNLVKLQTPSWEEGYYYKPRLDYDLLEKYHDGLTVTTACLGGIVNQHLLRGDYEGAKKELSTLVDIFGKEHVYVEIQKGSREKESILGDQVKLAKEMGLGLLPTADSHYTLQSDHDYHDTLLCCSTISTKDNPNRFAFDSDNYHLHSSEEMAKLFPDHEFPNALKNTVELAEKTDFTMKIGDDKEYIMPSVVTKKGMTEAETLRDHVIRGARDPKRYGDEEGNIPDHVLDRIDYELEVVDNMGFNGYFLIVENMIKMFAENGIFVGPGRGCLHPDTQVLTKSGYVPIKNVNKNDHVVTSQGVWSRVLENQEHETSPEEELVAIHTVDNNILKLTEKHKVFIEDENGNKVWKKAYELLPGDEILSINENSEEKHIIRLVEKESAPKYVYDLTIEGDPSFLTHCGTVHNSAPGSVVVYCLGITNLDPFRHDLFFERFLNPDRISMPDIDIDIPKTKRDDALYLLEKEYGEGHVAHLSNYNSMKEKDALRRVAKVFGLSPSETNSFSKTFFEYCEQYGTNVTELAESPVVPSELLESTGVDKDTIRDIIASTDKLAGTIAAYGVHACGIVITSTPVDDYFPIRIAKKATLPVCQYDGHDTEDLGGVKMDILGLINLDIAEDTESNILQDINENVDSSQLPLDDKATYKTLSSGKSGGIFQMGCLAGDTIIDGSTIKDMYTRRNSSTGTSYIRSVFLGEGYVYANRCMEIIYSGKKDIYRLAIDGQQELKATKDHKVFTQRGWSAIGDLQVGKDKILYVDEKIGHILPGTIRGRDDIYDIFEMSHPDFEMIAMPEPLTVGHKTFYPKFVNKDNKKHVAHIYPDSAHKYALEVQRETLYDNNGYTIDLYPYSKVLEEAYSRMDNPDFLLPEGTEWRTVDSLEFYKNDDTFDIMMLDPVNNFIANNIMVHNSSGIKSLMKDMKPDNFEDISATIALYRPGPMGMESHTEYARRKNGIKPVEYFHDDAKEVLKDTYGLCVSGDTMIYDADTGIMHRIDSIQEKVSSGMNTIGVRKDGTPISGKIEAWWCSGEKEIYRLETTEGTIDTSGDHPILTGNGWKHVKDITVSDKVALTNNSMCVNTEQIVDRKLAYILGLLLGDGCLTTTPVSLCNNSTSIKNVFSDIIKEFFPDSFLREINRESLNKNKDGLKHSSYVSINAGVGPGAYMKYGKRYKDLSLIKWIESILPDYDSLRSRDKYIPDIIYGLNHDATMSFLAGIFDTDGYVSSNTAHVKTVSKQLAYGLHLLMNKLGYSSIVEESGTYISKIHGETISYSLRTHDANFLKSIIPLLNHEDKRSVILNSSLKNRGRKALPYNRVLENVTNEIILNGNKRSINTIIQNNGKATDIQVKKFLKRMKPPGHPETAPSFSKSWIDSGLFPMEESSAYYINNLASDEEIGLIENIRWAKVKSCVNTGRVKKVYDISVPDIKNFIANGNIVVSNCVYQENIMSIAQEFAHYSGAEADELRKAVGKKIPEKMEEQHQKFIPAVNEHYPDDPDLGQAIWDIIEPFGSYAFNKSHSAAYGMLSYRTAWLKTHYPAQFAGASIDYNMTSKDKIIDTVSWIKEMGVHINHPDINVSQMRTVTNDMEITLPLHIIDGVGDAKANDFIQEREENGDYESVIDFIARNTVPKNMVLMMAKAGCFDNLGADRGAIISKIDEVMSVGNSRKNMEKINNGLFGDVVEDIMDQGVIDLSQPVNRVIDGEKVVDVTTEQIARWEREAVSFIMGTHPFEEFRNMKSTQKFISKFEPIDEIKEELDSINATAMLTNLKNRVSQKQRQYQTFELETDRGIVEALYFGERKLLPSMEDTIVAIRGAKMVADNFNPKDDEEESTGNETFKVICGDDDQVKTVEIEKFRRKEEQMQEENKKSSKKRSSKRRK